MVLRSSAGSLAKSGLSVCSMGAGGLDGMMNARLF
jgi:hypothetical protein